jgi:hypothetical protein
MITLKRAHGRNIILMKRTLRQLLFDGYWREVKRSQVARALRGGEKWLDGHCKGWSWGKCRWFFRAPDGGRIICIGCVYFSKSETKKILKWALAK